MKAWIETSFVCSIFLQKLEKSVVKAQILFVPNAYFLSGNYLGTILLASDIIRCWVPFQSHYIFVFYMFSSWLEF